MNNAYIRYGIFLGMLASIVPTFSIFEWRGYVQDPMSPIGRISPMITEAKDKTHTLVADFVWKHPVVVTVCVAIGFYGLYTLLTADRNNEEVEAEQGSKSVTFKAPHYDVQKRLYAALLKMHLESKNNESLERCFDILQQFAAELSTARFGKNKHLADIEIKLVELLNSMNDCLSLYDQKGHIERCDAMILKYAELLSLLTTSNHALIKTVSFDK